MTDNTKLSTEPYKGVRDFYPEDMKIQNYIFKTWREVAEEFRYEEYSASPLELTEIYTEKSGDEIVNEQTFTFTDRGGRSVTLRPEMTPTLARMVAAQRKSRKFPLRWFSIPNLFRYEKPQRGRKREHYQLNCDLMGIDNNREENDAEIITIAHRIMQRFGAENKDFEIRLNGPADNLSGIIERLEKDGITNVRLDETLARGQTYYTGMVFEVFDTDPSNPRALCGGGRYDNLLEIFDVEPIPTVGFGMGDITIRDFLETHKLGPFSK
ncbi:MAG: ATP phosphoribosyltransferase regulatory subunit [Nitrospira sp.]